MNGTTTPILDNSQRQAGARFDDVRIIWALFAKDVLEALKNKNTIMVLLTSLFMVLFYSVLPALSGWDEATNLLVYDGGSSDLVPLLDGSREVDLYTYSTEEQMKQVLTHGTFPELGLVIPAGFDRAIQSGETPTLEGYVLRWVSEADAEELRLAAESEISALLILAGMTVFWAYTVIDTILREFSSDVNFVDLGALVVLGFIAGLAVGLVLVVRRVGS